MIVLGLDTTTRAGSVALVCDGRLAGHLEGDASRVHAERLPGDLVRLLETHGFRPADVDVFAVVAGPGSFTGLRVGVATIQGLAFGLGRGVVAVGALDALGQVAAGWDGLNPPRPLPAGSLAGAVMDGQRGEVFSALYRTTEPSLGGGDRVGEAAAAAPLLIEVVSPPSVSDPPGLFERWRNLVRPIASDMSLRVVLAGDGALLHRDAARAALPPNVGVVEPLPPLAPVAALMAAWRAERGEVVRPHAVRPVYVRRTDAELARDRRNSATGQADAMSRDRDTQGGCWQ
ncbi:MAG: tRNA (adenosine(37)-N6)-threonylcarbamoyltransferase complex dimerization subunit type 1 TsaB [Vicinamibacterales bacterium]